LIGLAEDATGCLTARGRDGRRQYPAAGETSAVVKKVVVDVRGSNLRTALLWGSKLLQGRWTWTETGEDGNECMRHVPKCGCDDGVEATLLKMAHPGWCSAASDKIMLGL
jgi:hypothetical protein